MAATRDLVVQVTADVSGLQSGMAKAGSSLATMEKAARDAERQIKKIGEAGASFQKLVNDFAGVTQAQQGAARASADAFKEILALSDAVDDLKASLDPAYAATRQFQASMQLLDDALERGAISSADHAAQVDLLKAKMAQGEAGAGKFSGSMRGVFQQLSQVGQQTMATGNFVQALAIQLPDIGLAFGAIGTAVGLLAGVGLPMLMSAFGGASEAAKSTKERLDELAASVRAVHEITKNYTMDGLEDLREKYGEVDQQVLTLIENQRQMAINIAMEQANAAIQNLTDEFGLLLRMIEAGGKGGQAAQMELKNALGLTATEGVHLREALAEAQSAADFSGKAAALAKVNAIMSQSSASTSQFAQDLLNAQDYMMQLAASAPKTGWLNTAVAQAKELASGLWNAVYAKGALGDKTETVLGSQGFGGRPEGLANQNHGAVGAARARIEANAIAGAGGGGGGKSDNFDALRQQFASAAQIELDAYATQQEQLQAALDAKKISLQEFHDWSEQAQRDHQEKMSQIDVMKYGDSAQQAAAYFGVMQTALQSGNEKMVKAAKIFGAAEALINSWRAYAQTLADPKVPFFGKLAAGASVLAAGFGAVNAIKGAGSGGSGSASAKTGATAAAASSAAAPLLVSLQTFGGGDSVKWSQLDGLLNRLNDTAGDRGYKILVPA